MKQNICLTLSFAALFMLPAGCDKTDTTNANYKAAINDHYKNSPVCIWSQSKKLPAQAATADDAKTEGYDALTQAGLLTRTTAEKKVLIIASKQVNNYDLSDTGRSTWTPDTTQPGYGNFCYGHRDVTTIDNAQAGTNGSGAKTATVTYHYKISDVASWAKAPDMQTAFPSIATALGSSPSDTASLVLNGEQWIFAGK